MRSGSFARIAATAMIVFTFVFSGCGPRKEETPPPAVQYGVADLETMVKAHPQYSSYFKLQTEYNQLLEQYRNERNRLIQAASQQKRINAALSDQTRRLAAENELKARVKAKEDELNDGLKKLYSDISKNHAASSSLNLETLTPEERAEMANLQMKLTILGVTGEEKETIKDRLHFLMELRASREKADMTGWTADEVKRMKNAKEKAESELTEFSRVTAEDIKKRLASDNKAHLDQIEQSFDAGNQEWDRAWQSRIDSKQKQMADLKKQIMADIETEAARVASDKQLDMIFVKYKANINATDVTGDMVNRIVNIKQEEING